MGVGSQFRPSQQALERARASGPKSSKKRKAHYDINGCDCRNHGFANDAGASMRPGRGLCRSAQTVTVPRVTMVGRRGDLTAANHMLIIAGVVTVLIASVIIPIMRL